MGKHHRDRDRDYDYEYNMRDPRDMGDSRMRDPRARDPRMGDPRMGDPRMNAPRGNAGNAGNANNVVNAAGNTIRNIASSINFAELLRGIDINQIISLVTTLAGVNNMTTNQLGSMLRNLDLSEINKAPASGNLSPDEMKNQLSALADKLDQMGNGTVPEELLKSIKSLQQSPELMNMFTSFFNSSIPKQNKD
ncbi:hypothetical protein [Clostridium sp. DJ247]|uniref:hypothetical protein n=1 Tax=Clostridium sp. DJ247 TaxID=2726188 RepID=UPI0016246E25|nr:hypothetical protein [Clostridium sp. DJ247]MBC2579815.1 hypothetical protein [Clostridium sp. DJ247]